METDGRFIENVEDAAQIRSKLSCETDALRFSSAEGLGGAVELQVVEADTSEELQSLTNLGQDVARHDFLASLEVPILGEGQGVVGRSGGETGDALALDPYGTGHGIEAVSAAHRAGTGLALLAVFKRLLGREIGLQLGIKVLGLGNLAPDLAKSAAMLAPSMRRVEGEESGIEFLEGASAIRAVHLGAKDPEFLGRGFSDFLAHLRFGCLGSLGGFGVFPFG